MLLLASLYILLLVSFQMQIDLVDPITLEVIRNALGYTAEEMGIALRNSSYSPNIEKRMITPVLSSPRKGPS